MNQERHSDCYRVIACTLALSFLVCMPVNTQSMRRGKHYILLLLEYIINLIILFLFHLHVGKCVKCEKTVCLALYYILLCTLYPYKQSILIYYAFKIHNNCVDSFYKITKMFVNFNYLWFLYQYYILKFIICTQKHII